MDNFSEIDVNYVHRPTVPITNTLFILITTTIYTHKCARTPTATKLLYGK